MSLLSDAVVDTCDQQHKFVKLPDHPTKDGKARCPYCLAIGLDAERAEQAFDVNKAEAVDFEKQLVNESWWALLGSHEDADGSKVHAVVNGIYLQARWVDIEKLCIAHNVPFKLLMGG